MSQKIITRHIIQYLSFKFKLQKKKKQEQRIYYHPVPFALETATHLIKALKYTL